MAGFGPLNPSSVTHLSTKVTEALSFSIHLYSSSLMKVNGKVTIFRHPSAAASAAASASGLAGHAGQPTRSAPMGKE